MPTNNLFSHLPKDLSSEVFETLVQGSNLRIERIVSLGHSSQDNTWYDQDDHEWVILLQGKAAIRFADADGFDSSYKTDTSNKTNLTDNTVQLLPGDYINIPAHTKHRVEWTDASNTTIWLAIHYT